MKKQLVSILFALCMVLCLVPLAAFAEGGDGERASGRRPDDVGRCNGRHQRDYRKAGGGHRY